MDDELRELLRRRAEEVDPPRAVPESLARRVRRRIAWNATVVGMTLVVLVSGAFVGARALNGPGSPKHVRPASTPPSSSPSSGPSTSSGASPSPSPTGAVLTACTSGQLRAVGSFQGAAGSREGAISLTNLSGQTCTLEGTPTITLLDQNLAPITSGVEFSPAPPGWQVDAFPTPPGWPLVTLAPGKGVALVRIRWSNWCPDGRSAPLWQVEVPGGGRVDVNGFEAAAPPPCNGAGQPSTVEVGPFEPSP